MGVFDTVIIHFSGDENVLRSMVDEFKSEHKDIKFLILFQSADRDTRQKAIIEVADDFVKTRPLKQMLAQEY